MNKNKLIEDQYKFFKYTLYKELIKYSMISIQNKFKENEIIRKKIVESWGNLWEKEEKTIKEKIFLYRTLKQYKNAKIEWFILENHLRTFVALKLNNELYIKYVINITNIYPTFILPNEFNNNLISNDELQKIVSRCINWLKKNFNRYSQFKRYKKNYNDEYYLKTKESRGIKTRFEANQKIAEDRRLKSKLIIWDIINILKSKNIKITIQNIKQEIDNQNILNEKQIKLAQTQISIYLKILKNESLI